MSAHRLIAGKHTPDELRQPGKLGFCAGSYLLYLQGVFIGRLATDPAADSTGIWWSGRVLKRAAAQQDVRRNDHVREL
jgi:hypothetical protein